MSARGMVRSAMCTVCVACALCCARALAGTVELRGSADAVEGTVLRGGPEGVTVRVARNGLERDETIPWSTVRTVQGATLEGMPEWMHAGEALWRGRARVRRGDWRLAIEPLERAAARWAGTAPSPDGAAAALALTQAYVQAGRLADALPVAFEAMRQVRAGMPLPEWAQASAALIDAPRGLPAAIAPMAIAPGDAARAAAALRAFDAQGDAPLAHAAAAYAAMLSGDDARAPAVPRASEPDRQGSAFLDALRDARSPVAATRATGRRALGALRRALPAWCDAWVRCAIGESLAMEPEATARERGAVLLLSVECTDRDLQPVLAAAAGARAAAVIEALGDAAGAGRLRARMPAQTTPHGHPENTNE